jgi:UDP-2-acetamido-2-deoxy-ribo-hexuluronate aminotransferase
MGFMQERGIQTLIHYPVPVSRQPAFPSGSDQFPVSDSFAAQIVSLPLYPELSDAQAETVCRQVNEYPGGLTV